MKQHGGEDTKRIVKIIKDGWKGESKKDGQTDI